MLTTIHGFSSPRILPVYERYDDRVHYVAISDADRAPSLPYAATIHHGIEVDKFPFDADGSDDLLFFGRIHPDKGAGEAIRAARATGHRLVMCGLVQDEGYHAARGRARSSTATGSTIAAWSAARSGSPARPARARCCT